MYKRRTPYGSTLIHSVAISVCLVAVPFLTAHAQPSLPDSEALIAQRDFDIPAQDMATALAAFARQSGKELLYTPEMAQGRTAPTVIGRMSSADAMAALLAGSNLDFVETASGGFMVGDQATITAYRQRMANEGVGLSGTAAPDGAAMSRYTGIEEVIVTGQKREERIQDVPISISAFSMDALDQQKIEGGFDLLKAVPNVTFSKTNFSGYNFQIRGIGTQAVSATTDPGVAMSMNNTTLIVNRLFEQEYLDMERVEVLRGPQGTLFGRNATAGVINVISAKPQMGQFGGEIKLETGNYNARRMRGHANIPIWGDVLAMRLAYASTERDGFGTNLAAGQDFVGREAPSSGDLDNRDLWSGRVSLGWQPTDRFRANLIYERFKEDDHRLRSVKQLCHHDPGPDAVAGDLLTDITIGGANGSQQQKRNELRAQLSQGCLPGSLYAKGDPADPRSYGAYGTPDGNTIPFVRGGRGDQFNVGRGGLTGVEGCTLGNRFPAQGDMGSIVNPCMANPLAGGGQSHDLRTIYSPIQPIYRASSELFELSLDLDLTDGVALSSQTVYMENELYSTQDFLRFETLPGYFTDSLAACAGSDFSPEAVCVNPTGGHGNVNVYFRNVSPGGIYHDPQLGASDRLLMQDVSQQVTRQFSQELRLVSNFDGPLNYSIGINYTRFETVTDYFVFSNAITVLADAGLFSRDASRTSAWCRDYHTVADFNGFDRAECVYIQRDSLEATAANPEGHNFFLSRNPYTLNAMSTFGELYWNVLPTLKFTAGLRLNWDRKTVTPVPSQTLLVDVRNFMADFRYHAPPGSSDLEVVNTVCNLNALSILAAQCAISGNAPNGRGYPAQPDMVQEWRVPTGRVGLDWKPDVAGALGWRWLDESLIYAFYTRGYKAGGANPPLQAAPSGLRLALAQGAAAPPVFEPEYVNAFEIGAKNTLFDAALQLNVSAFYYNYSDYQVSKIVDRSAQNENFDATIWGLELEALFAPAANTLFNASIGYLRTRIADGERSLDLMDRTQGGGADHWYDRDGTRHELDYDEWMVIKPTFIQASNCIAPAALVREVLTYSGPGAGVSGDTLAQFCPAGNIGGIVTHGSDYDMLADSPNGSAGFFAEIGGHELPNAPRFTVSLGGQHTYWLPGGEWSVTGRLDWYWQDKSFARVYNTEYDRLRAWTNTNVSVWFENERHALSFELYIKNAFDETPITGAFLNSDDTGLSTNVFTLDPRLVGLSVRKRF